MTCGALKEGPAANPGGGQRVACLDAGLARRPRVDAFADRLDARLPADTCREALVGESVRAADEMGEALELVPADDVDDEPTVVCSEPVEDHLHALAGCGALAERSVVRDDVGERDHRVEHRDVEVLPAPVRSR